MDEHPFIELIERHTAAIDRMVVLAFLVGSDAESLKVAGHMLSTEFKNEKEK